MQFDENRQENSERPSEMGNATRIVELTFEKSETLLVLRRRRSIKVWCESCGKPVEVRSAEEASPWK